MFIKMTANDRSFHLGPLKMAQLLKIVLPSLNKVLSYLIKIPFIVFRLARLITSGLIKYAEIWYTHSLALSLRTFYFSRYSHSRRVMAL